MRSAHPDVPVGVPEGVVEHRNDLVAAVVATDSNQSEISRT
jgi:hypothetical protein